MKKTIISLSLMLMMSLSMMAQSDIVIGIMSPMGKNLPDGVGAQLENKMEQMVTKNGFGGYGELIRFVLTCSVDVLDKELTSGSPVMTLYKLGLSFSVLDTETGVVLGSAVVNVKGAGENDLKAYTAAIKAVRAADPNVKRMLDKSRAAIEAMLAEPEPEAAPADTTVVE